MKRTNTPADILVERKALIWGLIVFLIFFILPLGWERFDRSVFEALYLAREYAQAHVLL